MPTPASAMVPSGMPSGYSPAESSITSFTFGEPESVLDQGFIWQAAQVVRGSLWYDPPISRIGLGKCFTMSAHHQSAIVLKTNVLEALFKPTPYLSLEQFSPWAQDYLIFGDNYLFRQESIGGRLLGLEHLPAAWTRVGIDPGYHWYIAPGNLTYEPVGFMPGAVMQMRQPAPMQEIYGMPGYYGALQSGLLNENATLFRRRYYKNGAHAGYILAISDAALSAADAEVLKESMRQTRGMGNFHNIFLHIPNGKEHGVKVIPIAEVAAKDEFLGIKEVSRDDVLAAHRVPPQLLGIVPKNGTAFGNVTDAIRALLALEIFPIMRRMGAINTWAGAKAVDFVPLAEAMPVLADMLAPGVAGGE